MEDHASCSFGPLLTNWVHVLPAVVVLCCCCCCCCCCGQVGIIGPDRKFKILTSAEVQDYLQEVE
jgi:hypothetical protein